MQQRLLQWLSCPACGHNDLTLEASSSKSQPTFDGETREDVIEGALHCGGCNRVYLIREGIPRMLVQGEPAQASGHRWTHFDGSLPEYEENFLDMCSPLEAQDFLGKVVLDAGCGFGRHAFFAARYGAEVIAIDSAADAVSAARANTQHLERVHVIQADVLHPPLRPASIDLVYTYGVLHHLADPLAAFRSLAELVCPGGELQVWVYGPRAGSAAVVSGALRGAAAGMNDETLHRVSHAMASTLRLFSHTPYRLMRHVPVASMVASHLPAHDHHKWPFEVVVADIFDRLRIPVLHTIPGEELEAWFAELGFLDIRVSRRVRNSESFRGIGTAR